MKKVKTFSEFINESSTDKVIFVKDELWVTYSQSSGQTVQLPDLNKFVSDDSKDSEHFDSLVSKLLKWSKSNKPLKSKSNVSLFEIPEYPLTNAGTDLDSRYDIWGGNIKPIGKIYMIITEEKNTIVNFFKSKNEAMAWIKSVS